MKGYLLWEQAVKLGYAAAESSLQQHSQFAQQLEVKRREQTLLLLLLARERNRKSVFYKKKLPLELFQTIIELAGLGVLPPLTRDTKQLIDLRLQTIPSLQRELAEQRNRISSLEKLLEEKTTSEQLLEQRIEHVETLLRGLMESKSSITNPL